MVGLRDLADRAPGQPGLFVRSDWLAGHDRAATLHDAITYDPESADLRNARGVMFAAMGSIWTRSGAIGMR